MHRRRLCFTLVLTGAGLFAQGATPSILLADTTNGKPLFGAQGHFRLAAPKDKPGARSVRMLTKLQVVMLRK